MTCSLGQACSHEGVSDVDNDDEHTLSLLSDNFHH